MAGVRGKTIIAARRKHPLDRAQETPSGRSRHGALRQVTAALLAEARFAPLAAVEHLPQVFHGVPHVGKTRVERRETEAQDVGRAEVADHAAADQRLHDRKGTVVARVTDLAAAQGPIARRSQRQALIAAARVDQFDAQRRSARATFPAAPACRPPPRRRGPCRRRTPARRGIRSAACRRQSAQCLLRAGTWARSRTARRGPASRTTAARWPVRPSARCAPDGPRRTPAHRDRRSGTCSRSPRQNRRRRPDYRRLSSRRAPRRRSAPGPRPPARLRHGRRG